MVFSSLNGCGSTADAECKGYGTRFGDPEGYFAACSDDPGCLYVQTPIGTGGNCSSLFKTCCAPSTPRLGQIYQRLF
jgi:hypothetical protein